MKKTILNFFKFETRIFNFFYKNHRPIFWASFTIFLTYITYLIVTSPTSLFYVFAILLNIVSFGQLSPAAWYGDLSSYQINFSLFLLIKATVDGASWGGELVKGGQGIGLIVLSLITIFMLPFLKIIIIKHWDNLELAETIKSNFILEHPFKLNNRIELHNKLEQFIGLNFQKLNRNKHTKKRKQYLISLIMAELLTQQFQQETITQLPEVPPLENNQEKNK